MSQAPSNKKQAASLVDMKVFKKYRSDDRYPTYVRYDERIQRHSYYVGR